MRDKKSKIKHTIGIDEVGRGPLAGPVAVCALALNKKSSLIAYSSKLPLRDSKKMMPRQREKWFNWIKENKVPYAVCLVSPKTIDKINISNAANLAAARAFERLIKNTELKIKNCKIYLDGGLYLNKSKIIPTRSGQKSKLAKTIIRGDEKIKAIMLASIVAKVNRDKLMKKLSKKYPKYSFHKNKGYGTKAHFKSIKKFGPCKIHRRTFLKSL